jgi:23S rRNA (adenine2503-C2)-methyltransferase
MKSWLWKTTSDNSGEYPVRKFSFETHDGHLSQAIHVDHEKKHIICFPSQIGCPMQCKFCRAGKFLRNLESGEMIEMCAEIERQIEHNRHKPILFSCMGVGEPSHNLANLCLAFNYFHREMANMETEFGPRAKFAFSTLSARSLGRDILYCHNLVKVQFSIHALTPKLQRHIFGFELDLVKIRNYLRETPIGALDLNYMLIDGINDAPEHAQMLAFFAGRHNIKLNQLNQTGAGFFPSTPRNVEKFTDVLEHWGCKYEQYATDGGNIKAACGQLLGGLY